MTLNTNTSGELLKYIGKLEEENRKLNERIKELEQCNLSLQTWIDKKEMVNESLRKELDFYRKQYEHTMGED